MTCQQCKSKRLVSVCSKASDLHFVTSLQSRLEVDGYLPNDLGVGGGDYVEIKYCLHCGQIQGKSTIGENVN